MLKRSRLHLPRPPGRPGDAPDFSWLHISDAGATERPDTSCPASGMADLSTGLVRVLDEQHRAVGPWDPQLAPEQLREGLRLMVQVRAFDERMLQMQRMGKISFYVLCRGEEAVSVAAAMALEQSDMLFPYYRNQGLFITRGRPMVDLMSQCLSNTRDTCKGRQMPVLYHWAEGNLFSNSGGVATQMPQAVGWAMAAALKGDKAISAVWVGEGSTAEGDFHYALTFASVYQAPVILNIINNQWAISSFQSTAGGERSTFAAKGVGYGIPALRVDGNDFLAVQAATAWAAERARLGQGPTLIEHVTYRAGPHSTSDDPSRYRPKDESHAWPLGDPIERLQQHLTVNGEWSDKQHLALVESANSLAAESWNEALAFGSMEEGPFLDKSALFEDVFKEMPPHLVAQQAELRALRQASAAKPEASK